MIKPINNRPNCILPHAVSFGNRFKRFSAFVCFFYLVDFGFGYSGFCVSVPINRATFFEPISVVVLDGSEKQMRWVDAYSVVASVTNKHVLGNWSVVDDPTSSTGSYRMSPRGRYFPITRGANSAGPSPAIIDVSCCMIGFKGIGYFGKKPFVGVAVVDVKRSYTTTGFGFLSFKARQPSSYFFPALTDSRYKTWFSGRIFGIINNGQFVKLQSNHFFHNNLTIKNPPKRVVEIAEASSVWTGKLSYNLNNKGTISCVG